MRFTDALSTPGFGAVAEFKRRSPSAGDISPAAQVEEIASAYEAGGARAVSVLVDDAFAGSLDDLREGLELARKAVDSGAAAERLDELVAFSRDAVPGRAD